MRAVSVVAVLVATTASAFAEDRNGDAIDDDLYLVRHPAERWWLSGQLNVIAQAQPGFHSPYSGENSLQSSNHLAVSFVATVYAALEITPTTALMVAGESAGGDGLSSALGLGGFTNLDVVRNPTLGPKPYVGRVLVDQIIPLSAETVLVERIPFDVLRRLPVRRIEIRAGKLSTVDLFDLNSSGSDSHRQFMNWTVDNNGAYDYAADTRGYTYGGVIEYVEPRWAVRYGMLLMPTVANGIDYDTDLAHARGENHEVDLRECIAGHPGIVRLLAFWNHAKMGRYNDAIAEVRQGLVTVPDITATRLAGRVKYGFGANVEQEITDTLHAFARVGWNEGQYESFAYTEVDNTVLAGFDLYVRGGADKLGVAAVTNGLSQPHKQYLELGGKGFLLGDGRLHYGREDILETYYTARAYRGVFPALDVQVIAHPGYNTDRGPVVVGSVRLHIEI
ncbi:MAG: Carbohydrate-selective porin [Myxococcales bacterium]|nr:Carbohydrate-selective porin [Myxococcales bacterium]